MDLNFLDYIKHNQVTVLAIGLLSIFLKFRLVKLRYTTLSTNKKRCAGTKVKAEQV